MNKKILMIALALLLTPPLFIEPTAAYNTEHKIPNLRKLTYASMTEPEASDPAWACDTSSSEMIFNVYETLIFWPWERVPPDPHEFEPMLATEWVLPGDPDYPGIAPGAPPNTNETWYFKIRTGVPYHDPVYGTVTPADVEYSIERALVFDHIGGPTRMHYYPLLNLSGSLDWDTNGDDLISYREAAVGGPLIDGAVESNSTHVWFNLAVSYAPFIQILAQPWSSVYPQAWGTDLYNEGRFVWPGWSYTGTTGDPYTAWVDFNDNNYPQLIAPFDNPYTVMMGTGPYTFSYWISWEYQLVRFPSYWRGWPSDNAWTYYGGPTSASYFDIFRHLRVPSWTARRDMFLSELADKQADIVDVPVAYIAQIEREPGVHGVKNLPVLYLSATGFNYNVSETTFHFPYKPKLGGVEKRDLFSDKHMRKAFAYAFDYVAYLVDEYLGEAIQPASPIIKGLAFYNRTKPKYSFDMAKVQAELKQAWTSAPGGSAWDQGFYVPLAYNIGSEPRQYFCEKIKAVIESLGPRFSVDVFALDWITYVQARAKRELTNFFFDWSFDYADPDNSVVPFMHPTVGAFAKLQSVSYPDNAYVCDLIMRAASETPANRIAMYSELEDIYYAECVSVPLAQPLFRHFERDWMQGWYYNPVFCGSFTMQGGPYAHYVYRMWKGLDADTNGDGKVDGSDITPINNFFWDAFWDPISNQWVIISGPAGMFNRIADISSPFITNDLPRTWELDGTEFVWKHYGLIAGYEIPGVDGYINLYDQALVSRQLNDFVTPY